MRNIGYEEKEWMKELLGTNVRFDEPMSRHSSFRAGGPAAVFARPKTPESLLELIRWAWEKGIRFRIIGDGTNLLVKDSGFPGILIVLSRCFKTISIVEECGETVKVKAMAGARLKALCRFAVKNRLEGMKFAVGIPGTVGGAVMMNAGTAYGSLADVIDSVSFFHPNKGVVTLSKKELAFSYRKLEPNLNPIGNGTSPIVLEGIFILNKSPKTVEELGAEVRDVLEKRWAGQPLDLPSAGCFFKNPPGGKPAGQLIDSAGLKGKQVGGARVSDRHANFIVNCGQASGADILSLAEMVRQTVWESFGVILEPEVQILG
jgi:UDP-N-acetylmuramate dehydrogenase